MNRYFLRLIVVLVVAFGFIQGVRVVLGEGWSWVHTIGYGALLIGLCVAAWLARNAPYRPIDWSESNPATEVFDRGRKWTAPLAVLVGGALAVWLNDAPLSVLPAILIILGAYMLASYWAVRLIRAVGLRLQQRRQSR